MPPILKVLRSPTNVFVLVGVSLLLFDIQYYLMMNLPGSRDFMCIMGANLTPLNIGFSIIMSFLAGLMFAALIEMYRRKQMSVSAGSASGLGLFLGTMTVFCTACTLPVISLFGVSVSLLFFTDYEVLLKGTGIVLMIVGLWILNGQLKNECKIGSCT